MNREGTPRASRRLWAHPYRLWPTCTGYMLTVGPPWQCSYRHLGKLGRGLVVDTPGLLTLPSSWPSPRGWSVCRKGRMVSQPSGPLHHRPLPTTWLPVPEGGGQRAGTMLVYPHPHDLLGDSQYPWCVYVWGFLDGRARRSRRVVGMCDLGRTFSCT